jgi:hypothetical protein
MIWGKKDLLGMNFLAIFYYFQIPSYNVALSQATKKSQKLPWLNLCPKKN